MPEVPIQKPDPTQRIYLVMRKLPGLLKRYTQPVEAVARKQVAEALHTAVPTIKTSTSGFEIVSLPSRPSVMMETSAARAHPIVAGIRELVVTLMINPRDLRFFQSIPSIAPPNTVTAFGFDAPVHTRGYWAGGIGMGNVFSTRSKAERLIKRSSLVKNNAALTGQGVHVVLIDSGLDPIERQRLGMTYGLTVQGTEHIKYAPFAPTAPRYDHAFTMARNFKLIAPNVTLHDYAVLPSRLSKAIIPTVGINLPAFLSDMVAAYIALASDINLRRSLGDNSPWVISNSWSLYERFWDPYDSQDIPHPDHPTDPLNMRIAAVATLGADIIFCAGNGGQFGNDPRCGHDDKGPGRSIIGPNGHLEAITVGSVRTDGCWIGSSSQGPGIMGTQLAAIQKPDIVAPSDFIENMDGAQLNTGTSTACAVTAAVVAAVRQGWPTTTRAAMKAAVLNSGWQLDAPGWNNRTGRGILDVKTLIAAL